MKKLALIIFPILVFTISCDKVKDPIVKKTTATGSKFIKNDNSAVSGFKKVLLEDYTGQTCPNCPTAAKAIKNDLMPVYGASLVVLAVHQGDTYAKPIGTFTNDFRTTAGEEWGKGGSGFGIGFWPCGLINRKNYGTGLIVANQAWTSVIPKALNDPFVLKLDVNTEYDTTARALNVRVKGQFKTSYPNATRIVAVFEQDAIIGKQKDGSTDVEEYEFEHMMRGDINGTWGTEFKTSAAALGDTLSVAFENFALPTTIIGTSGKGNMPVVDKNVSVVVFVYDASNKNVLQAEKVSLRKPAGSN